jgi:hypothetical protein
MMVLNFLFTMGPVLFGVGFLAPLIAQSMAALGWSAPFGLTPLAFGLVVGAGLGALAALRGRWL